ncbi:ribosome maturation factor RimM [Schleiferiaceae bacterium]|jgi:16S rRNA processing protein RimM|nr:ribosome maturation factor RimM [Schleiferiaceae bacterium]
MEGHFQLGYIRKKHGFKGDVVLHIDSDYPEKYKSLDVLFLEDSGSPLPYFISSFRSHKENEVIIRLDGISSEEDASKLVGKIVFLPEEILPELNSDQFYYHEIIGFTAVDSSFPGEMIITDVLDRPAQCILTLKHPDKEEPILIPLVDDFWISIDKKSKLINLCAPAELYNL